MSACAGDPGAPIVGGGGGGGGGCIQDGDAQGEVAFWDEATQCYVPTTAPADGQIFRFDSASGLVVPVTLQTQMYGFGALGTAGGVAASWLFPGGIAPAIATTTELTAGSDTITRNGILRNFFVQHGNPGGAAGNISYVLRINGVDVLTLVLAATSAGPASNLVTQIAVVQGDRVSMRMDHAVGVGTSQRMRWNCEFTS